MQSWSGRRPNERVGIRNQRSAVESHFQPLRRLMITILRFTESLLGVVHYFPQQCRKPTGIRRQFEMGNAPLSCSRVAQPTAGVSEPFVGRRRGARRSRGRSLAAPLAVRAFGDGRIESVRGGGSGTGRAPIGAYSLSLSLSLLPLP